MSTVIPLPRKEQLDTMNEHLAGILSAISESRPDAAPVIYCGVVGISDGEGCGYADGEIFVYFVSRNPVYASAYSNALKISSMDAVLGAFVFGGSYTYGYGTSFSNDEMIPCHAVLDKNSSFDKLRFFYDQAYKVIPVYLDFDSIELVPSRHIYSGGVPK